MNCCFTFLVFFVLFFISSVFVVCIKRIVSENPALGKQENKTKNGFMANVEHEALPDSRGDGKPKDLRLALMTSSCASSQGPPFMLCVEPETCLQAH